jgi:hypothetical protein
MQVHLYHLVLIADKNPVLSRTPRLFLGSYAMSAALDVADFSIQWGDKPIQMP